MLLSLLAQETCECGETNDQLSQAEKMNIYGSKFQKARNYLAWKNLGLRSRAVFPLAYLIHDRSTIHPWSK